MGMGGVMPHQEYNGWPSVTKIKDILAKPFLYGWYAKLGWKKCEDIKKRSQNIGLKVHEAIQQRLEEKPIKTKSSKVLELVDAVFTNFINLNSPKVIWLEKHLISEKYKTHGTCDGCFLVGNEYVLLDWKTSSQLSKTDEIQLAGYLVCLEETDPDLASKITTGIVVNVNKNTKKVTPQIVKNLHSYKHFFLDCLELYNEYGKC